MMDLRLKGAPCLRRSMRYRQRYSRCGLGVESFLNMANGWPLIGDRLKRRDEMDVGDLPYASLDAVKSRDRERWLDLFDDDAVVEDPVGPCEWDPEGRGQRGKAEIAAFYDMFAEHQGGFDYAIHHLEVRGEEVALFGSLFITSKDGAESETKVLNVYKRSPEGKIASLRSFWNR